MSSTMPAAESQGARAERFRSLHVRPDVFVIPNPWDAGSARLLAALGFEALATTSAGLAFSLGRPDAEGAVSRDDTLANVRAIVAATSLPVAADLENGFGDNPESCAETIRLAAQAGLVGGSIEDATGRAENLINGRRDLADTIHRLRAFAAAGADVLYAPGLRTREEIAAVVKAVAPRPVNVVMGLSGPAHSLDALASVGVKRVSLGSSFARAAYGALLRAAREVKQYGTFDFAREAVPYGEINAIFKR